MSTFETTPEPAQAQARAAAGDARWDPTQYAVFGDHRGRPFHDLLARVPSDRPELVVDLGCGPGELTLSLADRWPAADVVGIDSSPEMLARARQLDDSGRVEWVEAAAEGWDPAERGPIDLLVTNAVLQWVPSHLRLLPRWLGALSPAGVLAMQVPANFDAPSHRLMREVAARHPRADELRDGLDRADAVARPETYAALLLTHTREVDVWQTTYLQVLTAAPEATHPVLEWVRGTGLRPVLGVLTDGSEREDFLTTYERELEAAYPRRDGVVLFPFTRTFAVARMPA